MHKKCTEPDKARKPYSIYYKTKSVTVENTQQKACTINTVQPHTQAHNTEQEKKTY